MKPAFRPFIFGVSLLAMLGALVACGSDASKESETASTTTTGGNAPTPAPTTTSNPGGSGGTFEAANKVISAKCVGCHQGNRAKGGIDLSSHDAIMKDQADGGPLVVAGDVTKSKLVDALYGRNGMRKMPPGGPLTPEEIKAIEDWVAGGAKS